MTRRLRRDGGFTLIELIAVILMVSVLAVAAVPVLTTADNQRAAVAARQLLRDVSFARQRAIASGSHTWVVFDAIAESWTILAEDPSNPGRVNATVIEDPATGRALLQTMGVAPWLNVAVETVNFDGDVEIGFDWLGTPLNAAENPLAADGAVTLTGNYQITVRTGSGLAELTTP